MKNHPLKFRKTLFYFKSTSLSRSAFFLAFVFFLMVANEMPQVRRVGSFMRLGLYAFCVISFLNYLIPVLVGRMGVLIFLLSWILSAAAVGWLVFYLASLAPERHKALLKLSWAPALILILIAVLYSIKWIPPVPLSLQYVGVYHKVERAGDGYELTYRKPAWFRFWRKSDRPYMAREGDVVYVFARVFAPRRFTHKIFLHWQMKHPDSKKWLTSDRIPLDVQGGRGEGFRGFAAKSNYLPGTWRVEVETEDGRVLGGTQFPIRSDPSTKPPAFLKRRM